MKIMMSLLASIVCSVVYAGSEDNPDSVKTYLLEPAVVTATKSMTEQKNITSSVSVITADELSSAGDPQLLSVISDRIPGMYLQQRGVLGFGINSASGGISMRGLGGNPNTEVLVLIDGSPQFMGLFGHPLPDVYRTESASKVEVIRGPASVLYGSNAMGGVINIITKNPDRTGLSGGANASYGTFNTQQFDANVGESSDAGSVLVTAGHEQTDGHRSGSSFNQNDIFAKGKNVLNDQVSVSTDLGITKFEAYDPGPASAPTPNSWYNVLRGEAGVSVDTRYLGNDGSLKIFYDWGKHRIFNGFVSSDDMLSFQLYNNFKITSEDVLTAGVDYEHYGGSATDNSSKTDYGSHHVQEEAGYLFAQHFLSEWLVLNGGLRLDHHTDYGSELVPQIGVAVQAAPGTTLKASATKGFRSPTIRELYLFPAPTPTLQPERMWDYETGVLQSLGERADAEIDLFLAQGDNLIETGGVYPNLTLSNSGRFVHRGIESSLRYRVMEWVDMNASYSYLATGNDTQANPRHKLYLGAEFTSGIIMVAASDDYIAGLYGDNFSREVLPSYDLLHFSITVRPVKMLSCRFSADNLLNESYQTTYDYPMPGRTFTVGISATY